LEYNKVLEIVNKELYSQEIKPCCYLPFLSGVIRGVSELVFTNKGFAMCFQSTDDELIELISKIVDKLCNEKFVVEKTYLDKGYTKGDYYTLYVPAEFASDLLEKCNIVQNKCEFVDNIPKEFISKSCCRASFLKGLFLSCGTLSTPPEVDSGANGKTKSGYHLEFILNSDLINEDIKKLIVKHAQIEENLIRFRTERSGIYLKNAEAICNLLASMGSSNGVLIIQQIITSREVKNQVNRVNNFDLANINKTVNACENQLEAINYIECTVGLDTMQPTIKEVCYLRKNNPDASLNELAELCVPPSTKSCMNHRLRKVVEIAETIQKNKTKE
jgi:DNA-binding protein WhiA